MKSQSHAAYKAVEEAASNWFDYLDFFVLGLLEESQRPDALLAQSAIWWQPITETTFISFANLTRVRFFEKLRTFVENNVCASF